MTVTTWREDKHSSGARASRGSLRRVFRLRGAPVRSSGCSRYPRLGSPSREALGGQLGVYPHGWVGAYSSARVDHQNVNWFRRRRALFVRSTLIPTAATPSKAAPASFSTNSNPVDGVVHFSGLALQRAGEQGKATTHGVNDYSIPSDIVDEGQREVDDTISAAAADKAATIPTTADMGDADEDSH
ncbi:hypothetical protein B0H14DRAFT_3465059 [Mycena olivaceomarginata]|nr:hypothetical protein B0H14DRAFT_3465059 [Mycena olivaceomarginata]